MTTITEASQDQLSVIHKLAYRIWPATFKEILSNAQMAYMLDMMYSVASLKQQMNNGCQFLLVKQDNDIVGYISYQLNIEKGITKLHKIYLLPAMQGKGIGKQMILEVIQRAKKNDQKAIHLNVNRNNKAALFYDKMGFHIIKQEDNDIGNGYFMNDYVMELIL